MTTSATPWGSWLRLVRPPNLPTVPGDPLAGFVLASGPGMQADPALLWAVLSAVALYAAGLILNDVADSAADRRERPDRPLPSGAVSRSMACCLGLLLGAGGVAVAFLANATALLLAGALFTLILVYDFLCPRGSVAGMLIMGLCRGGSVGLGIAASGKMMSVGGIPWIAAAGTGAYIVAVSAIAAGEARSQRLGMRRWLPAAILVAVFAALIGWPCEPISWPGLALAAVSLAVALSLGRQLGPETLPSSTPRIVGGYLRGLIPIQASYCATVAGLGTEAAVGILCLWPVSSLLARRFYAS